jgi:hypothetical protein
MWYLTTVSALYLDVGAFHERGRSARNNRVSEANRTGSWKQRN